MKFKHLAKIRESKVQDILEITSVKHYGHFISQHDFQVLNRYCAVHGNTSHLAYISVIKVLFFSFNHSYVIFKFSRKLNCGFSLAVSHSHRNSQRQKLETHQPV